MDTYTCCICGKIKTGYGNNPWPVHNAGECCDECNKNIVVPARVRKFKEAKDEHNTKS